MLWIQIREKGEVRGQGGWKRGMRGQGGCYQPSMNSITEGNNTFKPMAYSGIWNSIRYVSRFWQIFAILPAHFPAQCPS